MSCDMIYGNNIHGKIDDYNMSIVHFENPVKF